MQHTCTGWGGRWYYCNYIFIVTSNDTQLLLLLLQLYIGSGQASDTIARDIHTSRAAYGTASLLLMQLVRFRTKI